MSVLILGSGVISTAVDYTLAEAGRQATVCERTMLNDPLCVKSEDGSGVTRALVL